MLQSCSTGSARTETACTAAFLHKVWTAVFVVAAFSLALGPRVDAAPLEGIHKIQHVVIIMQENRSFDSYFGTYPGADGIPTEVCLPNRSGGGCQAPFHDPFDKSVGGPHGPTSARVDIDKGAMNGFVRAAESGCSSAGTCRPCNSSEAQSHCIDVMGYHDAREIPNYWSYAQNFVLQDHLFESVDSWSLPSHLYLVSGAGCLAGECTFGAKPSEYAWTDITYLLDRANVSWRYYVTEGREPDCENDEALSCETPAQVPTTPSIWNPLPNFTDVKEDGQLEDIQSLTHFYTAVHDESLCGLPNVSWIAPSSDYSEHPPSLISRGQAYVTTLINAIMRSPCWGSSAIFISWDDWGGFYDHVPPPTIDLRGYGIRVPGLVVSPYAKIGYIDHQQLSHDAYLKFIEDDFLEAARLNPATDGRPDNRPDVREEAPGLGDLANDFDFEQPPRPPLLLSPHPPPGPASEPPGGGVNFPTVSPGTAGSLTQTAAMLDATVNPNGGSVGECYFEYGTSESYGYSAPCMPSPGSGNTAVEVSASVEGLAPSTTYHFRVVAINNGGMSSDGDKTFTTLPEHLTVTSVSPNSGPTSGGNTVTVGGTGFPLGEATVVTFKAKSGATRTARAVNCASSTICTAVVPAFPTQATMDVRASVSGVMSPPNAPADQYTWLP